MPLVLIELVDLELNGRVKPATTGRNKKKPPDRRIRWRFFRIGNAETA
jgi:hypothetical protein